VKNNNHHNRRSVIAISAVLLLAVLGLLFVRTDYVAADHNSVLADQTQETLDGNTTAQLGSSTSVMPSLFRIVCALVVVIGSIYGGLYLLKKMMGKRYAGARHLGNLEVLETIHIAPRKTVTLLRVGEKSVLVGSTEGNMSLLSELDNAETTKLLESVETEPVTDSFNIFLKTAIEKVKEVTRRKTGAVLQRP